MRAKTALTQSLEALAPGESVLCEPTTDPNWKSKVHQTAYRASTVTTHYECRSLNTGIRVTRVEITKETA